MCGGVECISQDKKIKIFFPNPKAALPLLTRSGEVSWMPWGRRKTEQSYLPQGGWARLDSIQMKKWNRFHPRPVIIIASAYMEKDHDAQSHWFDMGPGMAIQGLLAEKNGEQRVYVVTVPPPAQYDWIHDRWPRLVKLSDESGFKLDAG